jgi:hypothetical protein
MAYLWIFATCVLFFYTKLFIFLDPDLGWHLRSGQLALEGNLFNSGDPFSYTMPSFNYVDHAWLTDVISYIIYSNFGMLALNLIFSLVAVVSLLIVSHQIKGKRKYGIFLLMASACIYSFFGIRTQVVGWLLFAILIKIIFDEDKYKHYFCLLPILFLFWVNLHGSFAVGLFVLSFWYLIKSIRLRKFNFKKIFTILFCWLVSLINPYGIEVWREVERTVIGAGLGKTIVEWMPSFLDADYSFIGISAVAGLMLWRYRKRLELEKSLIIAAILLEAWVSLRHIPLFVITFLSVVGEYIEWFEKEIENIKHAKRRLNIAYKAIVYIIIIITLTDFLFSMRAAYILREKDFYPQLAIEHLKGENYKGKIFSSYAWGGYLIWKLPEQKVFIDGRMPTWEQSEKNGESANVMKEYGDMFKDKIKAGETFDKYNIQIVLKPNKKFATRRGPKKYVWQSIDAYLENNTEWDIVYEDDVAVVWRKNFKY